MLTKMLFHYLPSNNRIERIWKIAQVDFQSRYYNDRLGLLWALIKPLFEAILYFVAFKFIMSVDTSDFGVFLFGGVITWSVFSEGTVSAILLLRSKAYLIENVQFQHIDLYFSHVSSVFFGYLFNLSMFIIVCLALGHVVTLDYILLPIVLLSLFLLTMAFSLILSTLQPFIKDITHLWDMLVLSGFWVSAVIFDPNLIFEKVPLFPYFNPFIGILMNVRGIFIDSIEVSYFWLWYNLAISLLIFIVGLFVFRKYSGLALEKL